MPENATVNTLTQLGPEGTIGTSVAATHQLAGMVLADTPKVDNFQWSPQGHLYVLEQARGKGWGELTPSGDADFNSVVYALSSLFGGATITLATGGIASKQWKWTPGITNLQPGQTYTVERGIPASATARKYTGTIFDGFQLNYTKTDITIGGHCFSREVSPLITITALTDTALVNAFPMRGTDTNLYIDPTSGAIGTTQLTRVGAMSIAWSNYFAPWYGIDRTLTSWSTLAPMKPKVEVKFRLMTDAAGWGIYNTYVLPGATAYVRFDTQGPIADGTAHFTCTLDMALKISTPSAPTDDSGLEVIEFTGNWAEDSAWVSGQTAVLTIINMIAAL